MIEGFFSAATAPFAVALILMGIIAVVELVGALMGLAPSGFLDSLLPETDIELDADLDMDVEFDGVAGAPLDADVASAPDAPGAGPLSQVLGWLCVGRVPILVLLIAFLTSFGLSGFILQGLVSSLAGFTLPAVIAVAPALFIALPATRGLGLILAKAMPKEQSEAVSRKGFVGRIATVLRGEARRGMPAEAKLSDQYGQTHYLLVEPDADDGVLTAGEEVLVVRLAAGRYRAIPNPNPILSDAE